MADQAYQDWLCEQGLADDVVKRHMAIIGDLLVYLTELGLEPATAGREHVERFAQKLIAEDRNTLENLELLKDYADWLGQRALSVALIELMDCHNALEVLADEIEKRHGRAVRDKVFSEPLPPLGADERERCAYARAMTARMLPHLSAQQAREAWFQVQHGIPADVWRSSDLAEKEKHQHCTDIDEFLEIRRRERNALLTRLRDEHRLWYTQEINDRVLEFIRSNPEMEAGRREGNRIYVTKVPYNVLAYLEEPDPRLKRNHICHCPMLREAIRNDWEISPDVCYCSLGHASHYLAGLDMEIEGEVLESAVKGDDRCRFVFVLPNMEGGSDA